MSIQSRLDAVRRQIREAEKNSGRLAGSVSLLAISKAHSTDEILEAVSSRQVSFGENYLQEALEKIRVLSSQPIEWHFVGSVQSNKTKLLAENFSWIHSVTRIDVAKKLNQYRPDHLPPLNICIQVNISNEITKSGIVSEQVFELAKALSDFPKLYLRGLMVIPAPLQTETQQHQTYQTVQELYQNIKQRGILLDTLSMGMSDDFQIAIAHGATLVRIGTAIFGARERKKTDGA